MCSGVHLHWVLKMKCKQKPGPGSIQDIRDSAWGCPTRSQPGLHYSNYASSSQLIDFIRLTDSGKIIQGLSLHSASSAAVSGSQQGWHPVPISPADSSTTGSSAAIFVL